MPQPVDVTTPSDTEIRVARTFAAPRALLFDCHTKPELVRRWLLGPAGWSMPVCEIDLRVGGSYRYVWRNEADGREFGMDGVYHEIEAPSRIVNVERYLEGEALCTLELEERDGRTTVAQTMRFGSREARDAALQSGMTSGMAASFDRLETLAEAQPVA